MGRYVIKRLLTTVVIVFVTAFIIFTILYFTPGEPARVLLGGSATEAEVQVMSHSLGTDRPYLVQLGEFMYNTFLKFDFGTSWLYGVPVYQELTNRLGYTLIIGFASMILNFALGISLGVFAGTHAGKWQDSVTMAITMVLVSCPNFWLALMMIIVFSLKLGWLPAYGINTWTCFILPVIASALTGVAMNARQMRSSILDVFRADFITTARAKGQTENQVVLRHMLPNAMMPAITAMGGALSNVIAGSAIIESVFSIPGVGLYMLNGINSRDYPVIRACVLFFAVFASLAMIVTDLAYAFLDPRIKARYTGGKRRKAK
ncbi:MAG: ABC transporter permease [Eubacteriales bacterium]|nr:ABC transporter permease [Eubacteriales bacterium]